MAGKHRGRNCRDRALCQRILLELQSRRRKGLTLDIPKPTLTPSDRRSHQIPAPAIPAMPVPLDQAPKAVFEDVRVGSVVVNWRKVSSPKPDDRDANEIPKRRGTRVDEKAIV